MPSNPDIISFYQNKIAPIPGWLAPEAAYFSAGLLEYQARRGLTGNIAEIGLYKGKYLSLMYRYARPDEKVVGVDCFVGSEDLEYDKAVVSGNVASACGESDKLRIATNYTSELGSEDMRVMAGEVRYFSVDGGHTAEDVYHDLGLAIGVLKEGGVIAMDDVFNHSLPGVTEGLMRYMAEHPDAPVAPFAHCYNKLFLSTRASHAEYLAAAFGILDEMDVFDAQGRTRNRMCENEHSKFTPRLFGAPILSFL